MVKYIDNYTPVTLPDGTKAFQEGCFNCTHCVEKHSTVSGRCEFISDPQYQIWKDFTCEKHNPIVKSEAKK